LNELTFNKALPVLTYSIDFEINTGKWDMGDTGYFLETLKAIKEVTESFEYEIMRADQSRFILVFKFITTSFDIVHHIIDHLLKTYIIDCFIQGHKSREYGVRIKLARKRGEAQID
jgi:hypothetical protein